AFAAATITSTDIVDNTIQSIDIKDAQIKTADLAGNAVTSGKIKSGEVKLLDIAPNSVDSSKIVDGSITEADLSDSLMKTVTLHDDASGLAAGWDPDTGGKMNIVAPDVTLESSIVVNLVFTTGLNESGKQCFVGDVNSGQFQLICNFQGGTDPVDLRYTVINTS
ncbi:MAG TPA: hypothetical protein VIE86_03015, partial [Nitrososphaera sp.]